jgi:hypothetical protein
MKTLVLTLTSVACACALGISFFGRPRPAAARTARIHRVDLTDEIAGARGETWRWQRLMGVPTTPARPVSHLASGSYQRWVLRLWQRRAAQLWRRATRPPHLRQFLCIHRFEGAWSSATGNGYYGGLQMDLSFQRRYAAGLLLSKGTANHWTPLEQIWAAERAHQSGLGFAPWPNTARVCGLL